MVLRDVFQGVIVPRAANTVLRVSRYLLRGLWALWPRAAYRFIRDPDLREDFLGTFAPFQLVALLVMWLTLLILGWGLFFYGIRDQLRPHGLSFIAAVYYAGASLLTIGYGDILPHSTLARMMSLVAGASGLAVVAVLISFLFAIFAAFQAREQFVVTIGARSGMPPSGIGLLEVHAHAQLHLDLANVFRDGQAWTAAVLETHLAYPILALFRSSHDYESWVGTLGALMDAASLVLSTVDLDGQTYSGVRGQAKIQYELGRHLAHDFTSYFSFTERLIPDQPTPGIEPHEFQEACERLQRAGYRVRDHDPAWAEFARLRSAYGPQLNALARWLEIPPVQWIGDRSLVVRHQKHITTK